MNLILSRKGFDSSSGSAPSPIFPDGSLCSLPIPDCRSPIRMRELSFRETPPASIACDLTRRRVNARTRVHLDPDLAAATMPRERGWRPVFGQSGASQSHLARCGVGVGDLFLFFGWFRRVERVARRWRYVRGASDLHVIFGWLRVGAIAPVDDALRARHPWLAYHPHFSNHAAPNNTLYLSAPTLDLPGLCAPGAGVFARFHPALQLTADGHSRRLWKLPCAFAPHDGRAPLSYHGDPRRWTPAGDNHVLVQSAGRGQEFVLDCDAHPGALAWLRELFCSPRI
ncbi:MAG: hypothetical protein ACREQF_09060 [Candidatus Binataceae bacterium]